MDELLSIASPSESGPRKIPGAEVAAWPLATADHDEQQEGDEKEPRAPRVGNGWVDALGLAEGGLLLDVAVILDLATIYLPLIGPVLAPAVPTPFAILMLRRGPRVTLLAAAVAAFLVTVITGPHFGWRMGLQAVIGLVLGGAMRRGTRPTVVLGGATLLLATVGFLATFALIFVIGYPIENIILILHNSMTSANGIVTTVAGWVGAGPFWHQIQPTVAQYAHIALQYWIPLYFLYVAAFSLPTAALYYAVANTSARVLGHEVKPFPPHWFWVLWRIVTAPLLPFLWIARLWDRLRHGREESEAASPRSPARESHE